MENVVVMVAPNGARRSKADHPALPFRPQEIAREAARCRGAGAAAIHLHVRDGQGGHSLDPGLYREAIAAVGETSDLLVQVTTEAVGIYGPDAQMAAMDALLPEAFSAALRELVPDEGSRERARDFLHAHAERGALVQHILYDPADVERFQSLVAEGVIPTRGASVLFVLGRYAAGQRSHPRDLLAFLAAWRLDLPWMLCAFGPREAACLAAAAAIGGHVRVGFENNLWLPEGSLAPDNTTLVERVAGLLRGMGLAPCGPDEARRLLGGAPAGGR